jgi:hypothetical protein
MTPGMCIQFSEPFWHDFSVQTTQHRPVYGMLRRSESLPAIMHRILAAC